MPTVTMMTILEMRSRDVLLQGPCTALPSQAKGRGASGDLAVAPQQKAITGVALKGQVLRKPPTKRKGISTYYEPVKATPCAVLCLVAQSCLTLCNPMDCSLPVSSVHGNYPSLPIIPR